MDENLRCTKEGWLTESHRVLSFSVNAAAAIKQVIPPRAVTGERLVEEAIGEDAEEKAAFFVGRGEAHLRRVLVARDLPAFIWASRATDCQYKDNWNDPWLHDCFLPWLIDTILLFLWGNNAQKDTWDQKTSWNFNKEIQSTLDGFQIASAPSVQILYSKIYRHEDYISHVCEKVQFLSIWLVTQRRRPMRGNNKSEFEESFHLFEESFHLLPRKLIIAEFPQHWKIPTPQLDILRPREKSKSSAKTKNAWTLNLVTFEWCIFLHLCWCDGHKQQMESNINIQGCQLKFCTFVISGSGVHL